MFVYCKAQWAKDIELRELREEVRRLKSEGKKPAVQFEGTSEEVKPEEDCKNEVDSEAASHKKLDQRKKQLPSSCVRSKNPRIWMKGSWRARRKRAAGIVADR